MLPSETSILSEVTVETVPQLFFATVGAYDQNDQKPNHSNFSVSDIDSLKKSRFPRLFQISLLIIEISQNIINEVLMKHFTSL